MENNFKVFKSDKQQITFEFIYLILCLIIACTSLFCIYMGCFNFDKETKRYLYVVLGGFLGGWTIDTKWFYRVIGRGKENQYPWLWESHKIFWRIFIPILSSITAFAVYAITISGVFLIIKINPSSGMAAFGFSYVIGCFSDLFFSKLANWAENILGKK